MNDEKKELILKKLWKKAEALQDKLDEINVYIEILEEQTNLSQFEEKEKQLKAKSAEVQKDVKPEPMNVQQPQRLHAEQVGVLP